MKRASDRAAQVWEDRVRVERQGLRLLRDSWVEWMMALPLTTFAGWTFREPLHEARADRIWREWHDELQDRLKRPLWGVRATEYQKRGALHYHAVLAGLMPQERVSRREVLACRALAHRVWERLTGARARFAPVTPRRVAYCAKHVTKRGVLEPFGAWPGEWTPGEARGQVLMPRDGEGCDGCAA
jgi:hypothetical protein